MYIYIYVCVCGGGKMESPKQEYTKTTLLGVQYIITKMMMMIFFCVNNTKQTNKQQNQKHTHCL